MKFYIVLFFLIALSSSVFSSDPANPPTLNFEGTQLDLLVNNTNGFSINFNQVTSSNKTNPPYTLSFWKLYESYENQVVADSVVYANQMSFNFILYNDVLATVLANYTIQANSSFWFEVLFNPNSTSASIELYVNEYTWVGTAPNASLVFAFNLTTGKKSDSLVQSSNLTVMSINSAYFEIDQQFDSNCSLSVVSGTPQSFLVSYLHNSTFYTSFQFGISNTKSNTLLIVVVVIIIIIILAAVGLGAAIYVRRQRRRYEAV